MGPIRFLAALAAMGLTAGVTGQAAAASPPVSSATITTVSTGPTNSYALTLSDSAASPSPIGTFWFSWVPGQDFLDSSPLTVTNPSGWTDNITHGGASDGYAIQWLASSPAADATAGNSLSGFGFTSTDSPASVYGNSAFFPTTPVLTAFTYDAAPFSDDGDRFLVTVVPEPVSLASLAPMALLMLRRSRR